MIRNCIGCDAEIGGCFGYGVARDVIAVQDGTRKTFPRELCGRCGEVMHMLSLSQEEQADQLERWLERRP